MDEGRFNAANVHISATVTPAHCYGNGILKMPSLAASCLRVCVWACRLDFFCAGTSEAFAYSPWLEYPQNKHCPYYSNENALGKRWYNFPLTPHTGNVKNGSGKPVTFDFVGTKHYNPSRCLHPSSGNYSGPEIRNYCNLVEKKETITQLITSDATNTR